MLALESSRWVRWNDRNLTVELAETIRAGADYIFSIRCNNRRNGYLLARLQLALQRWKQLRTFRFNDTRRLGRRIALAEVELLDPACALFDLVGGNQNLPHIFVGLAE